MRFKTTGYVRLKQRRKCPLLTYRSGFFQMTEETHLTFGSGASASPKIDYRSYAVGGSLLPISGCSKLPISCRPHGSIKSRQGRNHREQQPLVITR